MRSPRRKHLYPHLSRQPSVRNQPDNLSHCRPFTRLIRHHLAYHLLEVHLLLSVHTTCRYFDQLPRVFKETLGVSNPVPTIVEISFSLRPFHPPTFWQLA